MEAKIDVVKRIKVNFDSIENFCTLARENIDHFTSSFSRVLW
ncbi:hypothetical protein ACFLWD_02610 [Chloroflexota bacterium]